MNNFHYKGLRLITYWSSETVGVGAFHVTVDGYE